jgi:hypothetical protein
MGLVVLCLLPQLLMELLEFADTPWRRKQGHSPILIDLGGGARGGLTEWCRRELGPAGFEAVHAGFQGGDVRFEGVDTLVVLGK